MWWASCPWGHGSCRWCGARVCPGAVDGDDIAVYLTAARRGCANRRLAILRQWGWRHALAWCKGSEYWAPCQEEDGIFTTGGERTQDIASVPKKMRSCSVVGVGGQGLKNQGPKLLIMGLLRLILLNFEGLLGAF